jgi:hypothetical protein
LLTGRYPARPESATFSSGVPVTVDHPLISEGRVRFFLDPTTWMEHLAGYDFSFGSRIHGNIAALLAGTPALVLAHDSRTLELARYHEIPYRLITDDPDHIDAAQLYADADWEPLNAGHAARWQVFRDFLGQHGLRTVYDDGEDRGARFDEQLAAVAFPPQVGAPTGASPELLWQLRRELTEARRELINLRAGGRVAAVATAARVSLWPGWMSHPPGRLSLLPARLTDGLRNMLSAALDRSVRPARVGRPVGRRLRGPGGFGRPRLGLRRSEPDGVLDPTADGSGTTEDCVLTR